MPAAGTKLVHGDRLNVISRKLWKTYVDTTGNNIDYVTFRRVIERSNELIKNRIINNLSGYKMSESLGYIAIQRYKPKSHIKSVDYKNTKLLGKLVYHTNFHSYGYKPRIVWLTNKVSQCRNIGIYKFVSARDFSRSVSQAVKSGRIYNEFSYDDYRARKIRLSLNKLNDGL